MMPLKSLQGPIIFITLQPKSKTIFNCAVVFIHRSGCVILKFHFRRAQDPSANRYIFNFECGTPFLLNEMEFVALKVKGQSFMLHQIRKMVGTVIAIVRGLTTRETISRAWGEARFDLPIAPGLGLVLEQVHYDRYNTRFGHDGIHEKLTWDEYEEEIADFKRKYIDSVITETEQKEKSYPFMVY